jgi:hypothetical protein
MYSRNRHVLFSFICICIAVCMFAPCLAAEHQSNPDARPIERPAARISSRQASLESALVKMLSGATLEGSFTQTGQGSDPTKLSREKYTLGAVKKLTGNVWQIPARIQYGDKDVTIPIALPIRWAADTPVVVVDDLALPGFGAVSARVMFFKGHYAGYWKHGDRGGHLFGVIHPAEGEASPPPAKRDEPPAGVTR